MKIIEYCIKYQEELINYNQKGFFWKNHYLKTPFNSIVSFSQLVNDANLPEEIKREHVLKFFKKGDLYEGYILALIWGGISRQPAKGSNGNKKTSSAFLALNTDKEIIKNTLSFLVSKISTGDYETAYHTLKTTHKFSGVSVSFFTKLLYFISESTNSKLKLLIYDKWTKIIHLKLLLETNNEDKAVLFFGPKYKEKIFSNSNQTTNLIYCDSDVEILAYLDYCERLNCLSRDISNKIDEIISPGQVEEFIFGYPMRGKKNKTLTNPRFWIRDSFN